MDRIIDPNGSRMININDEELDVNDVYFALKSSIDPNVKSAVRKPIEKRFAQLAANIVDFADDDTDVTVFEPNKTVYYYGFEAQPFISEVAMKIDQFPQSGRNYFALELYNPFDKDIKLGETAEGEGGFKLVLSDSNSPKTGDVNVIDIDIAFSKDDVIRAKGCFVIYDKSGQFSIDSSAGIKGVIHGGTFKFFGRWLAADETIPPIDRRRVPDQTKPPIYIGWRDTYHLYLLRKVRVKGDDRWIYVDKQPMDPNLAPAGSNRYYGRDARDWHIVYQTLASSTGFGGTLGRKNNIDPDKFKNRNHNFSFFLPNPLTPNHLKPEERTLIKTVGDVTRILTIGPDTQSNHTVGEQLKDTSKNREYEIRLDVQDPHNRNVFQYLTVFDPADHGWGKGQTRIQGRININTAPSYVIAQLPWMTTKQEPMEKPDAVVAYRDKLKTPVDYSGLNGRWNIVKNSIRSSFDQKDIREDEGFETIGELNFVIGDNDDRYSMEEYALDNEDLKGFPDLTTDGRNRGDGITDDFEERDIIFSRISNLVTVRSDVFTAYILVRIGEDGPQKRVIAILDRSNVYPDPDKSKGAVGNVRIIALHPVPDPR